MIVLSDATRMQTAKEPNDAIPESIAMHATSEAHHAEVRALS